MTEQFTPEKQVQNPKPVFYIVYSGLDKGCGQNEFHMTEFYDSMCEYDPPSGIARKRYLASEFHADGIIGDNPWDLNKHCYLDEYFIRTYNIGDKHIKVYSGKFPKDFRLDYSRGGKKWNGYEVVACIADAGEALNKQRELDRPHDIYKAKQTIFKIVDSINFLRTLVGEGWESVSIDEENVPIWKAINLDLTRLNGITPTYTEAGLAQELDFARSQLEQLRKEYNEARRQNQEQNKHLLYPYPMPQRKPITLETDQPTGPYLHDVDHGSILIDPLAPYPREVDHGYIWIDPRNPQKPPDSHE